ncbi:cytochrome-c oxidase assembly protein [Apiospora sp. TS-2023a]
MNAFPRTIAASLRNTFQSAATSQWACSSCRRALNATRGQQKQFGGAAQRRTASSSSTAQKKAAQDAHGARMEKLHEFYRYKNRTTISARPPAGAANPSAPPGHGGAESNDPNFDPASRLVPVTDAKRIRVTFNASVSDILPWKFTPQQREVRVLPGETALAFYTATNTSDKDIIGVATYSVTPAQTAPYFSKIQCFCFEEQRLNAGETVDMPVFFYLDPDMLNDLNMRGVETVTLSYTFFKARYDDHGNFQTAVVDK